jgi:hypothetical protein
MKDVITGILDYCRHGIIKLRELYGELYALCEGATGDINYDHVLRTPVPAGSGKEHVSLYRRGPDISGDRRV